MESSDPSTWYPIYRDLARLIGVENTLIIFQNYHGLQVNFPIRLVSSKAIREIINFEYDGNNLQQLARKYGYSDRQIRRLLKEKEDEDILDVEESELPYITNIKRQIIEDGKKKKEGDIER